MSNSEVLTIGADPSGAIAGALWARAGYPVTILEHQRFPRFPIDESMLPQVMLYRAEADMSETGLQLNNGAALSWRDQRACYDFREKLTPGWGTTFPVQRTDFDQVPANKAVRQRPICSIPAGYAWDESNPYVKDSEPRLQVLHDLCMQGT